MHLIRTLLVLQEIEFALLFSVSCSIGGRVRTLAAVGRSSDLEFVLVYVSPPEYFFAYAQSGQGTSSRIGNDMLTMFADGRP